MTRTLAFALRWLRRDARAGELRLLVAALVVAVAALSAVGFFADRVRQALEREANALLGADLLLIADHRWPPGLGEQARALGLSVAETRTFPSMVSVGQGERLRAQLVEIKAVSDGYPLRGGLRVASRKLAADAPAQGIPPPGTIWIDERLASLLPADVGDTINVGARPLRVVAVLTQEPDRGVNFFSVAPRLLMNLVDLPATELIGPGSRVGYRLLLAGPAPAIAAFRSRIEPALARGERIEDAQNARPEIRAALDRAQKFLGLSALLTVVLAAVAVALAARRYQQRHLDPCAVMRCLGATQGFLLRVFLAQFALLGGVSAVIGCAVGYLAHLALYAWLAPLLATPLPPPGWLPAVQGSVIGVLLLFGFSLPPLWQLKKVSTLRVLRRELASGGLPSSRLLGGYLLAYAALAGLMVWVAGEVRLGAYVVGGFSAALLFFALLARGAVRLAAQSRRGAGVGWRYGLASLERRSLASVVQIVALALGFMALLLLTVTRNDLLDAWARAIPADAPNRFVVNIQPDQLAEVRRVFAEEGIAAEFSPMVRGRLSRINGHAVGPADYAEEQAKRLIDREFNLSYRRELPPGNVMTAGRWLSPDERPRAAATTGRAGAADRVPGEASIEDGLAKTLGLKLGDTLEFSIADEKVEMRIVGLRKLNWDSMRVNFFVLTPPAVLEGYPASWITSFYLAPARSDFVNRLVGVFPNLTVVDVAAIVRQLQAIMDQVAQAVQFVFLFTLVAGIIVLYAALASAAEERRYELAVMRALGARREQLRRALLAEFAVIGGLSGLIAALGAMAVGQFLARRIFQFDVALDLWLPLAATLGGAALVTVAGWYAATRLLDAPPLETLRAGG